MEEQLRDHDKAAQADEFKLDLVANPTDAMRPDIAVFILFDGMIREYRKDHGPRQGSCRGPCL